MRKTVLGAIAAVVCVALAGCNTIYGLGEDIEAAGKGLQSGSETVEEQLGGG
ncbi:MAG: entericidin [Pseudomonadota bacterium]